MARNNHLVVKKYLQEHSLVESNIISFNDFIEHKMQEIVDEVSSTINNDDFEIQLGKITVNKPHVIESDGSTSKVLPFEARLRNLTYSASVNLEITVKKDGQVDSEVVEIGRIPIMVRSKACNSWEMSKEQLVNNYSDPLDSGGYFIVNGNERVMVMAEDLAENQSFIERDARGNLILRMFSLRGTYRIPTVISENKEGIFELSFSRFRNLAAVLILKCLGLTKESDIAKYIGKETDSVIVNLYEFVNLATPEDAMLHLAEQANLQGTKKEILDRVKQRVDSYLFPHIGLKKEDRMKKAITLCKLIKQFLIAKENPDNLITDKDHYANKRVRLSGDLLSSLFRVNLGILIRDIQYSLQKSEKRKKFFSIKTIAKSTLFSHRVESAIATGAWTGMRSGITQNMSKTNYLDGISQLQRVASMLKSDQENFRARTLHPTHYGRFCPIETPEGTEIGLRKNLAILSRISTEVVSLDENKFLKDLESVGLDKEGVKGKDVFFNGLFIGTTLNSMEFISALRERRRAQELPLQMNFRYDEDFELVLITTEVGRALRPLIVVDKGVSRLKDEIIVPDKDTSGYRTEASYKLLENDGVVYPEAEVGEGEVMIGKVSPPKFLSEAREISIRTKKESSVTMRQEERGVVDSVFVSMDKEGNKIVQIRTRDLRIPEIGDKFATAHGQKGVVGAIIPEEDIPFTAKGVKPDVIFNPHGLPGRMTVGYLLELLGGKVGCLRGENVDGTSFSGESKRELEDQLKNLGFRYDGKETMYNAVTGKRFDAKIFVGNLYYLKLKYMVGNKLHGRASGKIALLTRQPVEGRSRGGALRLGEMEQQALVAHGASLLLKERYHSGRLDITLRKQIHSGENFLKEIYFEYGGKLVFAAEHGEVTAYVPGEWEKKFYDFNQVFWNHVIGKEDRKRERRNIENETSDVTRKPLKALWGLE